MSWKHSDEEGDAPPMLEITLLPSIMNLLLTKLVRLQVHFTLLLS